MRIWGDPVEFKEIKIYPIRMKDYTAFYENVSCLMYEKNKIQDVRVIKMSYLDFLFALMREDEDIFKKLEWVLKLVFLNQIFEFRYSEDGLIFLYVNDVVFNGFEFEKIQKYILDENMIKTETEIFDTELEKALQEAADFEASKQGKSATLEERVVALHCLSGIHYERLKDYTIFQFNQTLTRHSIIKNFDIYSALMAENGASKDVVHWLAHIEEKGKYADVIISQEEFEKITSDNGLTNK